MLPEIRGGGHIKEACRQTPAGGGVAHSRLGPFCRGAIVGGYHFVLQFGHCGPFLFFLHPVISEIFCVWRISSIFSHLFTKSPHFLNAVLSFLCCLIIFEVRILILEPASQPAAIQHWDLYY